jgi:hypothetical protein
VIRDDVATTQPPTDTELAVLRALQAGTRRQTIA